MQARLQAGEGTCGERAAPGGRARTRACPRAQTNTHMYGDMYTHASSASALLAAMLRYGEWDGVWAMHAIQQAQQSAKHSAQSILRHSERDPAMTISVPPRGHFELKIGSSESYCLHAFQRSHNWSRIGEVLFTRLGSRSRHIADLERGRVLCVVIMNPEWNIQSACHAELFCDPMVLRICNDAFLNLQRW